MELGRLIPIIFTLASRNLFHDRIRLIATLVGIVFSVVLFTVQLGLFLGFQRMVTTMIDHASADLWIAPADTKGFEATALLEGRERFRALAVPGVADVTPVLIGFTYWRKPNGKSQTPVFLVGTAPGGLQPWNLVEGGLADLSTPQAVAVDRSYFDRLGVSEVGRLRGNRRQESAGRRGHQAASGRSPPRPTCSCRSTARVLFLGCRRHRRPIFWCARPPARA